MEPRFSLPDSTPRSSKTELVIGGVKIYIYGLEELKRGSGVEIGVLHLAHMRTRTYLVTEAIAHEVLHRYRSDGRKKRFELIAVTMDMRNHGEPNNNSSMDLLSVISASTQDFKLILDYLPTYFPQFTKLHNIMLGISLGAHTSYRLASLAPSQIEGYAIVVGCPNLSSLLLTRLGIDPSLLNTTTAELGSIPYPHLEKAMNKEQKRRWPRALAELIREGDRKVYEEFPTDVPMLICGGKQDPLVPTLHTAAWLEKRREHVLVPGEERNVEVFVQENTGHSCTKEMVVGIAVWIGTLFEVKVVESTPVLAEARL
ncbi:uncharacterized protein LY89DRAFT_708985 [Mollisia scopiformis]|uniref:AB hydrolase-1 domain-containing protein n=1 Tax=Mollisia scopiformis TaxID=149040 RepID=A0A194X1P7_MOLSC|nr:uncharacterized protein LY89DRAFT_708985 [Mollisia scopiformis]KUJ13909.1 hypothetical protein LY89DRAFT_708985 [Mollisia scopiformis]